MEYELINPSDPYTFIAEDFETAALVVLVFGIAYGANPKEGEQRVPIFLVDEPGAEADWYEENFGRNIQEGLAAKCDSVADALETMMLGEFRDRERYNIALASIDDPKKRKKFMEVWQSDHSSLNDIGKRAWSMAAYIRENRKSIKEAASAS